MLGKLFILTFLINLLAAPVYGQEVYNTLEFSPLKAAARQPSIAWEFPLARKISGRVFAEHIRQNGQRDDYEDSITSLALGVEQRIDQVKWAPGLSVGAGLGYQYGMIGGSADRAYISSMRAEEKIEDDRWVNEVQYLTTYQTLGYRYFMTDYMSVGLRYIIDQVLERSSRTVSEDVESYAVDTSPKGRGHVSQSLSIFAGFHF